MVWAFHEPLEVRDIGFQESRMHVKTFTMWADDEFDNGFHE